MKLSFIVIDDSELDCYIAERLVKNKAGAEEVCTYTDANHALSDLQQRRPETGISLIILLDIRMPVMNGMDFLEGYEKLPPDLKERCLVIVMTSSLNENEISAIKNYTSVKAVLEKPIQIEPLIQVLEENHVGKGFF